MLASGYFFESLLAFEPLKRSSEGFGLLLIHKPEFCKCLQRIIIQLLEGKGFKCMSILRDSV